MSERAIRWSRQRCNAPDAPRLYASERHLLVVLATYHSEVGTVRWPTVPELAAEMDFTPRRIQQLTDALVAKGALLFEAGRGRGNHSTYTLLLPVKGEICEVPSLKDETGFVFSPVKGEILEEEKVKSDDVKGEISKGEKVKPASSFGGTIGGSTSSELLRSSTSLTVLSEPTETRAAKPEKVKRAVAPLGEITEELVLAYAGRWTADDVQERIDYALNHAASKKWLNRDIGLRRWLKRDADSEDERRGNRGTSPPQRNGTGPPNSGGILRDDMLEQLKPKHLQRSGP